MQPSIFYLILSGIIAFLTCSSVVSMYGIFKYLSNRQSEILESVNMLNCQRYEIKKEIYQYNDYWIMSHVVKAEHNFKRNSCSDRKALLVQRLPVDIYNIDKFVRSCTNDFFQMDIAVYLATPIDLDDAITAIRYMYNCSAMKAEIRKRVNFHLYFHTEILAMMPIPADIELIVRVPINCKQQPTLDANSSNVITTKRQAEIETVGRNVLRQISYANLHIPYEERAYPEVTLCTRFANELLSYIQTSDVRNLKSQALAFRRPTFVVPNFNASKDVGQQIRHNSIANYLPYDTLDWFSSNDTSGFRNITTMFDDFVQHISYFILFWHAPLLDDRSDLTTIQRENLFLLRLAYEGYPMIMLHSSAAIYTPTDEDLNTKNTLKSRNQLNSLDKTILEEYKILFK